MAKITKATIKAFVKKNQQKLLIAHTSRFDGMIDGIRMENEQFKYVNLVMDNGHNLGIDGAWLVNNSNDYFTVVETSTATGYEIYNCCGCFKLVVLK